MSAYSKERTQGRIERAQCVTDDLRIVWIRTEEPLRNYRPGRFCVMRVLGSHSRAYSIVSLSEDNHLIELFVELIPPALQGERSLTPKLWQCAVGDKVSIAVEAQGDFVLKDEQYQRHNHIMVATVTGIAPFMAMLRERLDDVHDPNRFLVFFGASYCDELAYHNELLEFAAKHPDRMVYISTVSRPHHARNATWVSDPDNGFETGRVNAVLEKFLRKDGSTIFGPDVNNKTAILYACGNGGMIESVRSMYASEEIRDSNNMYASEEIRDSNKWIFVSEAFGQK